MVGDSQRRPDRNRRAPEARARGRSAPNIILITRGRYLDEWPPAQSLSGAVDLFYRRGAAGGAELMEFCSALAIARYHPTGGGYEKVQVGRTHSGSNHISMANAASEGPYYGPLPITMGPRTLARVRTEVGKLHIIGRVDIELGTDASADGPCKTVSANLTRERPNLQR